MKICVYGAGAVGGVVGGLLSAAGEHEVSLVARGAHLQAMQTNGLKLECIGRDTRIVPVRATAEPAELGVQDCVIITLKAHQAVGETARIARHLLGPDTTVVTAMNGVPWWYFYRHPAPWTDRRVPAVDPGDTQWRRIGPERVLGCVVYIAASVPEPGTARHAPMDGEGGLQGLLLGEPDGCASERLQRVVAALTGAGVRASAREAIRRDTLIKLWGNVSFNPVTALTLTDVGGVVSDPAVSAVIRAMMREITAIGAALGVEFDITPEMLLARARSASGHRSSMHQDMDKGRPLEIDALVRAVSEVGAMVGVPTPTIDTVLALIALRARTAGLYQPTAIPTAD